jgi:hypothetical protein
MSEAMGDRIVAAIDRLRTLGATVQSREEKGAAVYELTGDGYHVKVVIDAGSGLALEFTVDRAEASPELTYSIDTDLYDVTDPDQQWFVTEIEDDIVALLAALADGRIKVERKKGRTVAVLPSSSEYVRVERGRLLTSQRRYEHEQDAEAGGTFRPLRL